ncbi:MAG TPA: mannose-1-phosphate guanylyltransferase/mannose-6-phosphate isomerase [Burkholderiales bacterium]|jgi:mannose-1-phosphate guanylyltransferase/mannose-6-phosphate isomerase|nr:mannose-1-phosphate guanylyltransferase/mannose-6-phosphate isomerase [Burkholderiales bacterium]
MPDALVPVILCGGSGSRLWPMSRRLLPKQFLPLVTEHTLLQDTVLRLRGLENCGAPVVVLNHEHRFLAAEQLQAVDVPPRSMLLEPIGRNTAPAVAAAALHVAQEAPDAVLLVLPADHLITNVPAFHAAVRAAAAIANEGLLVAFGIAPTYPATGFGYIECGEPIAGHAGAFHIRRFVEKPDSERAQAFLAQGGYLWNGGMFAFRAGAFLAELERLQPEILAATRMALASAARDLDFLRLDLDAFSGCPSDSIDYAVMERTNRGAVVRADMGWSDVGSWSALWETSDQDAAGNVTRGDVWLHGAARCYVRADARHVSVLGAEDLVIVETDDALLVATRERAQEVKEVVARLDQQKRSEHVSHTRVYRPWGYYESVDSGERFQVKRLMVKPGHGLSLQLHRKRAEHWVVVKGRATVTRGEETTTLDENQSTFIPVGTKHRLQNLTDSPIFLIEVQSGSYLGEDDIERFDDRYGRS